MHRQNGLGKGKPNLLFNYLPYLQNHFRVSYQYILPLFVLGKPKCTIPGDFICPLAKLSFWLNIVAEIFLCSSGLAHMSVRKVFELQT